MNLYLGQLFNSALIDFFIVHFSNQNFAQKVNKWSVSSPRSGRKGFNLYSGGKAVIYITFKRGCIIEASSQNRPEEPANLFKR